MHQQPLWSPATQHQSSPSLSNVVGALACKLKFMHSTFLTKIVKKADLASLPFPPADWFGRLPIAIRAQLPFSPLDARGTELFCLPGLEHDSGT